jgi:hypothetical protein
MFEYQSRGDHDPPDHIWYGLGEEGERRLFPEFAEEETPSDG